MLNNGTSSDHFDEMQVQIRNKVGMQSFFMLYFLLLADLLLKDYGVEWAATPISVFVIMTACMGYFLIRVVWAGAYAAPRRENDKRLYLIVSLVAIMTAILAVIRKTNFFQETLNVSDSGFLRLLIFFLVFFTIIIVFNTMSRRNSNKGNE